MTDANTDTDTAAEPAEHRPLNTPADFALAFNLIALAADPRGFKKKLQGLHRALTAVDEGMARLAADQAAFEKFKAKELGAIAEEKATATKRLLRAQEEERSIEQRREVIDKLERAWAGLRLPGEPPEMFGSISRAEPYSAVAKARYAATHDGALPDHPDAAIDSVRTGNDGEPFVAHTTLTRTPEPPGARVRPGRSARAGA
ncbi:MAG: hypothetical protein WAK04_12470 [Xanthobacteraceae bacterium]